MIYRKLLAELILGVFGLLLIWKGLTNDVMRTRLGDVLIPKWMYVVGGVALLLFLIVLILL
jgi:hypothetical protein